MIARSAAVARFVCASHSTRQYDAVEVLKVSSLAGPSGPGCKANDTLAGMAFGSRKKGVEKLYVVCLSKDEAPPRQSRRVELRSTKHLHEKAV